MRTHAYETREDLGEARKRTSFDGKGTRREIRSQGGETAGEESIDAPLLSPFQTE